MNGPSAYPDLQWRCVVSQVIRYLQKKKSPRLATVLEQDVPDAPENVVDMSFKERKPKHAPEQQRSNLGAVWLCCA